MTASPTSTSSLSTRSRRGASGGRGAVEAAGPAVPPLCVMRPSSGRRPRRSTHARATVVRSTLALPDSRSSDVTTPDHGQEYVLAPERRTPALGFWLPFLGPWLSMLAVILVVPRAGRWIWLSAERWNRLLSALAAGLRPAAGWRPVRSRTCRGSSRSPHGWWTAGHSRWTYSSSRSRCSARSAPYGSSDWRASAPSWA